MKQNLKTKRSSNTENNFGNIKFGLGEEVKVIIYSENSDHWYIGKIIDINSRYVVTSIESSWKVDYLVSFNNKGGKLRYWFSESELKKYCLQEERNSIIEQIFN